jgi:hypothetical protein
LQSATVEHSVLVLVPVSVPVPVLPAPVRERSSTVTSAHREQL